jgi:acetylornithine/succinyldiaminopimelate/putrescine aminotransferase
MYSHRELFLRHVAQTSPSPLALEITHAEGCYMYDRQGNRFLDLISGISVSALGHSHPAVVDAIRHQAGKYLHLMVYGEFVQYPQVELATAICATLPQQLQSVYFTNSGAEATEGAMKLAKRATGRYEIISCENAYHGSTQGALSLAGQELLKNSFRPLLPATRRVRFNNLEDLQFITGQTAAVFVEPVQGEAGAVAANPIWIRLLRERCSETGALLVLDEIQTGMGRTGILWAFEALGIVPDILLLGKAFGGGMPLGAFISSQELMHLLTFDPILGHITTFGGHPLCCAAALAAFKVLTSGNLVNEVPGKELLLRNVFSGYEVSGKGLLLAVEMENFDNVQRFISHAAQHGIITDWFLFNDHCIRIAPPLIISGEEIESLRPVIQDFKL